MSRPGGPTRTGVICGDGGFERASDDLFRRSIPSHRVDRDACHRGLRAERAERLDLAAAIRLARRAHRGAAASAGGNSGRGSSAAPRCRAGRGACRGATSTFSLGTAISGREYSQRSGLELVSQLGQRRPARVGHLLVDACVAPRSGPCRRPGRGRRSPGGRGSAGAARARARRGPRRERSSRSSSR